MAFTSEHEDMYREYKKSREIVEYDRRNTGFHFNKADVFNSETDSFNQMFQSEMPDDEVEEGLELIINDF